MKIVLASGERDDPTISIALVQKVLQQEFELAGNEASCLFGDDLSIRVKRATELEFSLKCAFLKSLDVADVLDFKVGDGLYSAVRRRLFERRPAQLLVARSHGLDHINWNAKQRFAQTGGARPSWREKLYAGRYLLWQVHSHMRVADLCLFLNEEERDYAVERLHVDAAKSFVIDNGIPDYLLDLPTPQRQDDLANLRIAIIGTYVTRKINVAPKAVNTLLARHARVTLGFLGTGVDDERVLADYERGFHARIKNVKKYDHTELPTLLSNYDVLLFPSIADGFGMVVFEAMACGLGVIASNLVSLTGRLRDGNEAVFFQRSDPDAMVKAVERVMSEPGLLGVLRREGYGLAQTFSWRRVATDTLAIYAEMLLRKSRSRAASRRR